MGNLDPMLLFKGLSILFNGFWRSGSFLGRKDGFVRGLIARVDVEASLVMVLRRGIWGRDPGSIAASVIIYTNKLINLNAKTSDLFIQS